MVQWSEKKIREQLKRIEEELSLNRMERRRIQDEIDRLNMLKYVLKDQLAKFNPSKRN